MLSIQRFIQLLILIIISILYMVFSYVYLEDQQQKTDLIVENIRQDLSETAYVISSEMSSIDSIQGFKALLNRKVANTPLISALAVAYPQKIILTTDLSITKLPPDMEVLSEFRNVSMQALMNSLKFKLKARFYIQDQAEYFTLVVYLNHEYVHNKFYQHRFNALLFFGLIPLLILVVLWLVLRRMIISPLEYLRQYAYYQSDVPERFKIKELESVRASMVQTFARLEHEKSELYKLSRTDALSGLANRNQLNERLSWLISENARSKSEFALLFVDLDNFKSINDSLGHEIGDDLLRSVAGLIQDVLRQYDIISRIGGDEFVIVVSHYKTTLELTHILERILNKLSELHVVKTHPVRVSGSIGVAFYPKDGGDTTSLMKNADIAMYEAKKSGKNQYKFFTQALQQQVIAEIELDHSLRKALKNKEFQLYYQPKISVKTGEIVGAEALIRWIHPTKGLIPPNDFIPCADKTGFMVPLGQWILEEAIQQQILWKKIGVYDLKISVNLSASQFLDERFDEKFKALLKHSKIDPRKLDIEITESVFMEDSQKNLNSLTNIRDFNVSISLDDFGTGYSSLAYLKQLPINTLKIDKSFLDDYQTESGAIFIETIVKIAHTLQLNVVAEGVESKAQLDYLKTIHCNEYQGYYCSRPLPAPEFALFLKKHKTSP
jgi:diguanylate cyclase (GGDEF)-like protein